MASHRTVNFRGQALVAALALAAWVAAASAADAQFFRGGAVGGVKVDANGVVSNPQVSELKELRQAWQAGLADVPADLQQPSELRFVSLKRLEAEAARAQAAGEELPEAVRFMAGLTRVKYVLVYPEQHDIVLAGPAEGWRVDARGSVVGAASGQPVLLLDDLMAALRAAEQSNMSGISCSIDPTPEGMQRLQQIAGSLSAAQGAEPRRGGWKRRSGRSRSPSPGCRRRAISRGRWWRRTFG